MEDRILSDVCALIRSWSEDEQDHNYFLEGLTTTVKTLLVQFINNGHEEYFQEAIYLSVATVGYSTEHDPDRSLILCLFYQVFYHKYLKRRDYRDLQYALKALFEDLKHSHSESLIGLYGSISDLYLERFNHWHSAEDINKAASYARKAASLLPNNRIRAAKEFHDKGILLVEKIQAVSLMYDERVDLSTHRCIGPCHIDGTIAQYMSSYAVLLAVRAGGRYGSHDDIDASICWAERAAKHTNGGYHVEKNNLSNRYYQRYKCKTKDIGDLNEAIQLQKALRTEGLYTRPENQVLSRIDRYEGFMAEVALIGEVQTAMLTPPAFFEGPTNFAGRYDCTDGGIRGIDALYEYNYNASVLQDVLIYAEGPVTSIYKRNSFNNSYSSIFCELTRLKNKRKRSIAENLCRNCSGLPEELFRQGTGTIVQFLKGRSVIEDLRRSVSNGCHLCALVNDCLTNYVQYKTLEPFEDHTKIFLRASDPSKLNFPSSEAIPWSSTVIIKLGTHDIGRLLVTHDSQLLYGIGGFLLDPPKAIKTEIFTPSQFAMVNSWIDECIGQHVSCRRQLSYSKKFELPGRLISINKGNPEIVPVTTWANLEDRKRSIDYTALPRTFREAIKVSWALKISLLWIDSLCIIQDDLEDWEREGSNMHRIYENAQFTISASESTSSQAGLWKGWSPSNWTRLSPCTLEVRGKKRNHTVTVYPPLADWESAVQSGPISTRGWCYQERQLSRRVIHLTEMRILWECKQSIASEDRREMQDRPPSSTMADSGRIWDTESTGQVWVRDEVDLEKLYYTQTMRRNKWCQVVEEYSGRQLSFPEDKLPVLSGIAQTVARLDQGGYLAGLWRKHLARDLSWFPSVDNFHHVVPYSISAADPLAPSWSWAAFPGPVSYHRIDKFASFTPADTEQQHIIQAISTHHTRLVSPSSAVQHKHSPLDDDEIVPLKVISAETYVMGTDPFGRVNGGKLVVSGMAAHVTVGETQLMLKFLSHHPNLKCYLVFKEPATNVVPMVGEKSNMAYNHPAAVGHGFVCFDANPKFVPNMRFTCLRLGRGVSQTNDNKPVSDRDDLVDMGILLMEEGDSGHYTRIGIFEISQTNKEWVKARRETTLTIV